MKRRLLFFGGVLAASLAVASPVFAELQMVSGSVGPVQVPDVPVQLCVGSGCQQTPVLSSVGLRASAFIEAGAVPPTIQAGSCGTGSGGVLVLRGGSAGAIVSGVLFGTRPGGAPYEQAIGAPINLAPNMTTTISACTAPSASRSSALSALVTSAFPTMGSWFGGLGL